MLRKTIAILCLLMSILIASCNRGDVKISVVTKGEIASHDGVLISPDNRVKAGDICKLNGVLVYAKPIEDLLKEAEPND